MNSYKLQKFCSRIYFEKIKNNKDLRKRFKEETGLNLILDNYTIGIIITM